jgi:hypothetical protein
VEVQEARRHWKSDSSQAMDHGLYDEVSYALCLSSRGLCQMASSVSASGPESVSVPGGHMAADAMSSLQESHSTLAKSCDSLDVEA